MSAKFKRKPNSQKAKPERSLRDRSVARGREPCPGVYLVYKEDVMNVPRTTEVRYERTLVLGPGVPKTGP